MTTEKSHRINREASASEARLTEVEGEALGIVKLLGTLHPAKEKDVDLVKITPTAQPPTRRPTNYDEFKYQGQRKAHDVKLKQKVIQVRKVKLRPGTDDNDYGAKLCNATRFPEDGNRVKMTLRFRGYGMAHRELGTRMLGCVKFDPEKFGQVEQMSKTEGCQVVIMLASKKKK